MRILFFIPTASVYDNKPSEWLQQRLDKAIEVYKSTDGEKLIMVSGRWKNVTDSFELTEAEVAKRYILEFLPNEKIIKEELSVETGGNFAFSAPIIKNWQPDKIIIFNSKVNEKRIKFFSKKTFGEIKTEFYFVDDSFSKNERTIRKEPKALKMFEKLFGEIEDGDDKNMREILLYKTPFYFKGVINDKTFFDEYWEGGFEDFLDKRLSIDNK